MGEGSEIILPIEADDTWIGQIEPWIARVEFQHLEPPVGTQDGKGCFTRDLCRALRHSHQQPGLLLKSKDSRIQQACHLHAFRARTQVPRPEDRILGKTLRQIVHHGPFGTGKNEASPAFRTQTNRVIGSRR
jgi:hypothetical protein